MKALAKDREQRYGSVLEFAHGFAGAAKSAVAAVGAVREPPLRDQGTVLRPTVPPTAHPAISAATGVDATKSRLARRVGVAVAALLLVLGGWYVSSVIRPHTSSSIQPSSVRTPQETVPTAVGKVEVNPKDGLKYVWIPPGTFMMGCSPGDNECQDSEKPLHQVTITKGFWLGQTEVTAGAHKRFAASTGRAMPTAPDFNPGWSHEQMPMVNVSWDDAQAYCAWAGGRLPTEAEWEYAARAGSMEARYGPTDEIAWYLTNSGGQMHEVAQKRANGFGLFDMLGNVWEWVNDWSDAKYYQSSPSQDPAGAASGQKRVMRGGSWLAISKAVRLSNRAELDPGARFDDNGFRCGGEVFAP